MAITNHTSQGAVPWLQGQEYPLPFQSQPIVSGKPKEFPVRTLKVLGSVQIGLGILLGVLSIVGIIIYAIQMDCSTLINDIFRLNWEASDRCTSREEYSTQVFAFDITCLVLSGWSILTGLLPLCMSRKRERSWGKLRVGFMVCSIIGATIVSPTTFSLGVVGATERKEYDRKVVVLSAFLAALSVAELVVSIIGASYCCCCTPWKTNNSARVIYSPQQGVICSLPQTQIQMTTDHENLLYAVGLHANPIVVQYPRSQQYQVIATNSHLMSTIQPIGSSMVVGNNNQQTLISFDPPAYKE